jgi:hypothetical protein
LSWRATQAAEASHWGEKREPVHLEIPIVNLKLASRSFRQLPKLLFLRLFKEALSWFLEFDELRAVDDRYWELCYSEKDLEDECLPNDQGEDLEKQGENLHERRRLTRSLQEALFTQERDVRSAEWSKDLECCGGGRCWNCSFERQRLV